MKPDITLEAAEASTRSNARMKSIALRLPAGLADRIREKSRLTGESQNALLVQAVRNFLGEGGPATEDRIERLEQDVTAAVTAFAQAAEGLAEMQQRLSRLEALARRSGANL